MIFIYLFFNDKVFKYKVGNNWAGVVRGNLHM